MGSLVFHKHSLSFFFFPFRLRLGNDFDRDAAGAMLDLAGDDAETSKQKNSAMKW